MYSYISKRESLFVAGLTAALYAAVYFYERGAASELNIPLSLITLSIPTISNDIMSICLFLLPVLTISIALLIWAKDSSPKRAAAHLGICGTYFIASYVMLNEQFNPLAIVLFNCLVLLHLLSLWVPLNAKKESIHSEETRLRSFGLLILNISAVAFFFSMTFIGLGRTSVHKIEFTTFVMDNNEYAIVKIYDENVFTWNVVNDKVIHQLNYFRLENINGVRFKQKSLNSGLKTE